MNRSTSGTLLPRRIPRPWDFPPGSIESRAAARAMLSNADAERERERIEIVSHIPEPAWEHEGGEEGEGSKPEDRDNNIRVGEWNEYPDGRLWRMVYVPPGIEWPPTDPASVVVRGAGASRTIGAAS